MSRSDVVDLCRRVLETLLPITARSANAPPAKVIPPLPQVRLAYEAPLPDVRDVFATLVEELEEVRGNNDSPP